MEKSILERNRKYKCCVFIDFEYKYIGIDGIIIIDSFCIHWRYIYKISITCIYVIEIRSGVWLAKKCVDSINISLSVFQIAYNFAYMCL